VFDYILFIFISAIPNFLTDVTTCVFLHSFYVRVYCFLVNFHNVLSMDGKKKQKKKIHKFLTGLTVSLRNKSLEVQIYLLQMTERFGYRRETEVVSS